MCYGAVLCPVALSYVQWTPNYHLSLAPAGPGQFLAIVESYSEGGGGWDGDGAGGFWVSPFIQVWLADAVTETMTLLVEMLDTGRVAHLHTNGRDVRLDPAISTAMVGLWPSADHTKLMVWGGSGACEDGVAALRAVELGQSSTLDWVWRPEDLLPEDMRAGCTYDPWNLSESVDEDGDPSLLLGVSELVARDADNDEPSWRRRIVAWSPESGPMWDLPLENVTWPPRASYSAWNGGGALVVTDELWEGSQYWHVVGPDGIHEGAVPDGLIGAQPGPLLDPEAPTFMLVGRSNVDYKHSIRVLHEGSVVWQIEALRFGLSVERKFLSDVVLLAPVPE